MQKDDEKIFSADAVYGLQRSVQRIWHCSSSARCNQALPHYRHVLLFPFASDLIFGFYSVEDVLVPIHYLENGVWIRKFWFSV